MRSTKALRLFLAIIALTGIVAALALARPTAVRADAPKTTTQEIEKVLKRHESFDLDAPEAARQVRADGRLSLTTRDRQFDLELKPNDLRAQNYRAEEVVDGGKVRYVNMNAPIRTFRGDRKSTRLNSSHGYISYAVFCLKKKKQG